MSPRPIAERASRTNQKDLFPTPDFPLLVARSRREQQVPGAQLSPPQSWLCGACQTGRLSTGAGFAARPGAPSRPMLAPGLSAARLDDLGVVSQNADKTSRDPPNALTSAASRNLAAAAIAEKNFG